MNKVTAEEAKDAIRTIKKFCSQVSGEHCTVWICPIKDWCASTKNWTPEEWEVE